VIETLVEEFTDFEPDTDSFAEALTDVAPLVCGFALFDDHECIDVCSDIAWQSLCSLSIRADAKVYLRYLAKKRTPSDFEINSGNTLEKSVELSVQSYLNTVTRMRATWRSGYADLDGTYKLNSYRIKRWTTSTLSLETDENGVVVSSHRVHQRHAAWVDTPTKYIDTHEDLILESNIDKFGMREETFDFFIYNDKQLVN
jgi:hypothetical protein